MKKRIRKAVFPVGGLGTRFLPATKSMPKEMLPVAGKPMIQHAFEEAKNAGIEQFIFITSRNKNVISNHFDHSYELQNVLTDKQKEFELSMVTEWLPEAGSIVFIRQQNPQGLGHAIWCARHVINDEPFAVLLADEMIRSPHIGAIQTLLDAYYQSDSQNIIGTAHVDRSQISKYGIVEVDNQDSSIANITNMIEKPLPSQTDSNLSILGRYILSPDIFNYLKNTEKGKNGEVQLTDAMFNMLGDSKSFSSVLVNGDRHDCGSYIGFLEANIAYALEDENIKHQVKQMLQDYK